ncbi:hypothetical protein F9C07_1849043 [Aspergillus flavus]|uniref:GPI anchored protein n=1 Tax=Aspergillus flavus (strain ATCC 200026 / FGSC A1120 / IAM 13836 / NRRL 3357 / JCM 12722 / SRRC 167) TaxID=332952 RepID=A0A7G5KH92_ASPFN|nr:uncharacterized protein G4B84_010662 [Aspergillus flavus NRRL3357]QMW35171.1 hypothetical protein G4B84_010662 [Aspergillus flavus NRRL3357]QMW47234.1 hypothetical protein G4B11_010713 [Aspergillus flavus]QRD91555.1 hypothetical protein F9C07_1849043 [Aspergillus flavus]
MDEFFFRSGTMNTFRTFGLLALLAIFSVAQGANLALDQHSQTLEFPKARRLSAASLPPSLRVREIEMVALKREASFDFIHEVPGDDTEYVFTTTLNVASQHPILALEALETDIDDMSCSDSKIQLSIDSPTRARALKQELEAVSDFVVVTSHEGCDLEGERSIHHVTKTSVDLARQVFTLEKVKCDWHDASHSTSVSFSHRHRSRIQRRTYTLHQKRQQEATSAPTTTRVVGEGSTPSISFPAVPTATTGLPSSVTKSLDKHYVNQKIFPPDTPAADMFIPQGVTVTCKNCTLQGDIEITRGSFNISGNTIKDTIAFFDDGALEITSNGLFAQVELGLSLSLSQSLASLNMSLPTIPLTPFEIPGVVAFGPIIQPDLSLSLNMVEEIGFSYGFNLSVPDNSNIKINMSEPGNSSISGFDKTKVHALEFESTSAPASLIFSVTFTPQILLGISTAKGFVSGGVGAFVNLPKVSVNATQLSHVSEKCEPVADKGNEGSSLISVLDDVFDSLTHIAPSVDIDMGVLANMEVDVADFSERVGVQAVLASTSYPLPTACLKYDAKSHTYGTPSRTPSATATSGSTKGAADSSSDSDKQSGAARLLESLGILPLSILTASVIAVGCCGYGVLDME